MPVSLSRREALVLALTAAGGCRSSNAPAPAGTGVAAGSASAAAPLWGGLEVAHVSAMSADERGGTAVVLLHGFGASGDDLVPLAQALQRTKTRFICPAAPIRMASGGRAWWNIDAADRPRYVNDTQPAPPNTPNQDLERARQAVQGVLRSAQQLHAPEQLFIAGFSQGAMLSLDVALSAPPAVQRVGVLSGALLVDAAARLGAQPAAARPAVFISHGRADQRLPYSGGERMKAELETHGFAVTWRPFEGGHQIPEAVVSDLRAFLFGA